VPSAGSEEIGGVLERVLRDESGRVLAALIAAVRDFDVAEDALQDAVSRALERWPREGVPANPAAWLTVAARRRAIDLLRHASVQRATEGQVRGEELRRLEESAAALEAMSEWGEIPDERLRLVFTCCHPALGREAQVALTLRTLGGLETAAVARAFLVSETTMAKRLVRAKRKIRDAAIPYVVPEREDWGERLGPVLAVVYLIFNQGYSASGADPNERAALCNEAIRLARVLALLLPGEPEVLGLLALLCLHDARREARRDAAGEMVALEDQDPARWDAARIAEGREALLRAAGLGSRGAYQIQAAISAAHVAASLDGSAAAERWARVAALYAELEAALPTPVVRVNRAVAVGRAGAPDEGLALLATLEGDRSARARLEAYQPYHAARADLLRSAGRSSEAAAAYDRAIELAEGEAERRFLSRRREATLE